MDGAFFIQGPKPAQTKKKKRIMAFLGSAGAALDPKAVFLAPLCARSL